MKKIVLLVVVFIVGVSIGLVYFTYSKPAPKAAALLPESTLLFVEVPDFPLARDRFVSTEAYALLQEPEVEEFLAGPRDALAKALGFGDSGDPQQARVGETVLRALQGEVFAAVTRLSTTSAQPKPRFVFGADVKRKRLEATAALAQIERRFKATNPGATVSQKKYFGVRYAHWQLADGNQFCHAFLNSLLVVAFEEDDMRDVITRFAGQAAPDSISLGASARFLNARRQMPGGHALLAYLNVEPLMGLVGPLMALAPQSAGMFQKMARIQATAGSVTFADDLVEDVGLVAYSHGDEPSAPASKRKTLALTSPETSFYSMHSVDWSASYAQVMNTVALSGNATLSISAAQFELAVRSQGIRIREDLLAKLGPETATIATWRPSAQFPDLAIVAEFDNTPESRRALNVGLGALKDATLGLPWEEIPYRDETLYTARVGGSIAPTYVTAGKFFILTLTPDYARELLNQLKDGKKTLAANPAFELMTNRLPASGKSLTYCDLQAVYGQLYALAHANASETAPNQLIQLAKLPRAETITKHLSPYMSVTVDTRTSSKSTALSPLGKPLTLLVGVAGGIGAAQPFLAHLPLNIIPGMPTMSSGTGVRLRPRENQTAPSQTPPTE